MDIMISDLKPEIQEKVIALLGDNGNYDVFPIATLEEPEPERHYVSFSVKCIASYQSELELPPEFFDAAGEQVASEDEILTYVRMHLSEANVHDLEFQDDLDDITDAVWASDIKGVS